LLLDRGANEDAANVVRRMCLMHSLRAALTLATPGVRAQNGRTPLHFAAVDGRTACLRLLLERGANKGAKDTVRSLLVRTCAPCFPYNAGCLACTQFGDTPLHDAARRGHVECAQALVQHGANTHATNSVRFWLLNC
jgi:ankyrin repeat protein